MGLTDPRNLEALVATPPIQVALNGDHKYQVPLCSPLHQPTLPLATPAPSSASTAGPVGISTLRLARQESSTIVRAQRFNKTLEGEILDIKTLGRQFYL